MSSTSIGFASIESTASSTSDRRVIHLHYYKTLMFVNLIQFISTSLCVVYIYSTRLPSNQSVEQTPDYWLLEKYGPLPMATSFTF